MALAEDTEGNTTYAILSADIMLTDWNMVVLLYRQRVLKNASICFCEVSAAAGRPVNINYRLSIK